LSVIDTLSTAFHRVSRRPWLITIPVLLDLFFWFGPRLSIAPLVDQYLAFVKTSMSTLPPGAVTGGDMAARVDTMFEVLPELASQINLFSLLSLNSSGRLGVPAILGGQPIGWWPASVIEMGGFGAVALLPFLAGMGLLLTCLFMGMLAQDVRDGGLDIARLFRRVPAHWISIVLVIVPLGMAFTFALSIGLALGPLSVVVLAVTIWVLIYMTFFPQAVILGEAGPLGGLVTSFAIVRFTFWPTVGLVVLNNVIGLGLSYIWKRLLIESPVGTLVAVLANAYVGTALTLALFIFYRDRLVKWHEALSAQRSVEENG
jgi:hypothetical protein